MTTRIFGCVDINLSLSLSLFLYLFPGFYVL
jgi:hypothetical protein